MSFSFYVLLLCALFQIGDLFGTNHHHHDHHGGTTQKCLRNIAELTNLLFYSCGYVEETIACQRDFSQTIQNNRSTISVYVSRYFAESRYDVCANLADFASQNRCVDNYCQLVRCIRRINSDILIDDCFSEAITQSDDDDQVTLYKNITACILAKARCSQFNPITGQPQSRLYNALQINPDGDLRIIAFNGNIPVKHYLCPWQVNLKEAGWLEYNNC